jgi:DNA-binding NtrC family response regulator
MSEYRQCAILIIEDEPSVADALRLILDEGGYRVSIAFTGRDGIQQACNVEFCLVITDVALTDMTGFDVIKTVCEHKPGMHFIVITSSDSEDVIAEAQNCAAGFLSKPFLPADILQLISATHANH